MKLYCSVDRKGQFLHNHCAYYHRYDVTLCPATKEQRDTLMKAMTDAGYTFDFEKKELKKIEAEAKELTEQKHVGWSDYDECMLTNLIDDSNCSIDSEYVHWLKSFKDRVQPQLEWSEEDNRMRKAIIDNIKAICEEGYFVGNIGSNELIDWLKYKVGNFDDGYKVGFSAAKYKRWKPLGKHLEALAMAINDEPLDVSVCDDLNELYEQLKQL